MWLSRPRKTSKEIYTDLKYRVIHKTPPEISDFGGTIAAMGTPKGSMSAEGETRTVSVLSYRYSICPPLVTLLTNVSRTRSTVSADGPGWRPVRFAVHMQPLLEFHIPLTNCFFFGSVWYMVRNLRCTVTIDPVLANSNTQNVFIFLFHAMFRHDLPLAVKTESTLRRLVHKKLGEILYLLICSFLLCLSWLLRSRVRILRRDL
jgi:hypothetical protein